MECGAGTAALMQGPKPRMAWIYRAPGVGLQ